MTDHVTAIWTADESSQPMTTSYFVDHTETPFNATRPRQTGSPTGFAVAESIVARYLLPVVIAAGTFGNVTSLAVLLRRRMRRTSVFMYLTALACADLSVLYLSAFKTWIRLMTDFEMLHVSQAACKTLTFLLLVSLNMSAWLIVLTTVDRFVAVWLPLRAVYVCRHRRACLAVGLLLAVVSALNVHVFWSTGLRHRPAPRSPMCAVSLGPWFVAFEFVKLASYSVVPFVVILLLNGAIIARLRFGRASILRGGGGGGSHRPPCSVPHSGTVDDGRDSPPVSGGDGAVRHAGLIYIPAAAAAGEGRRRAASRHHLAAASVTGSTRQAPAATTADSASSSAQARVTYMLLTVSIAWLALTGPWTLRALVGLAGGMPGGGSDPTGVQKFVTTVCFMLMYANHSVNFYLYCVTGRKFRRELVDMFASTCLRRAGGGRDVDPPSCCCCCLGRHRCAGCCGPNERDRSPSIYRSGGGSELRVCGSRHGNKMATAVSMAGFRSQRGDVTRRQSPECGRIAELAVDTAV